MYTLGEKIKLLRKQHKMTLDELGKVCGTTGKAVWTWEHGKCEPRIETIQTIADYFGVKKSDLIEEESYYIDMEVAKTAELLKSRPQLKVLMDASRDLSKADIDFIINMVNGLKRRESIEKCDGK